VLIVSCLAGTARLPQMRMPSMWMAGFSGALGGFCLAYQVRSLLGTAARYLQASVADALVVAIAERDCLSVFRLAIPATI